MNKTQQDYYARRAREYERIYDKPEREEDLNRLRTTLPQILADHEVLEIACGTGYWTSRVASTARSILATDINNEVLEIARHKSYPRANVNFQQVDAYSLSGVCGRFTAGLAAFWWSHIPQTQIASFLKHFHTKLVPGALVVFVDNCYVEGSSTPISHKDPEGNTYQIRRLTDGAQYKILKNFPSRNDILSSLGCVAEGLHYQRLQYYWYVTYTVAGGRQSCRLQ